MKLVIEKHVGGRLLTRILILSMDALHNYLAWCHPHERAAIADLFAGGRGIVRPSITHMYASYFRKD
jgi:hypothetical protein